MSEKTEYPTAQKLRKAREDGQVAHSKDLTQAVLNAAIFGYIFADASNIFDRMSALMLVPVQVLGMRFEDALQILATHMAWELAKILAPFIGIVLVVGISVEWAQTEFLMSFKALTPSGKKLNVINNVKQVFSMKNLMEFIKSNLKVVLLSVLVYYVVLGALPDLLFIPQGGVPAVGQSMAVMLKHLVILASFGHAVIAIADFIWQRRNHIKELMMTKDEVQREYKENEGDAHIKHHRKQIHREMLEDGAVPKTRKASAVIVNPTHLAVALLYKQGETPLPLVLAKGEGAVAYAMVAAAREERIPVMQNIPLARALMATADIDHYIPSDLIEPVAEVLRLIQELGENPGAPS